MRRRKINDKLLLEMLKEGKSQREIASIFLVSESAVSQRATKLLPPCLEGLTPKEQKFCVSVAEGKSRVQSVVEAYDVVSRESAKSIAHRLMDKPEIKTAIQELLDLKGLGREYRFEKLKVFVDHNDPVVGLTALKEACKIGEDYPNPNTNINIFNPCINISEEEKEQLRQIASELARKMIARSQEESSSSLEGSEGQKEDGNNEDTTNNENT